MNGIAGGGTGCYQLGCVRIDHLGGNRRLGGSHIGAAQDAGTGLGNGLADNHHLGASAGSYLQRGFAVRFVDRSGRKTAPAGQGDQSIPVNQVIALLCEIIIDDALGNPRIDGAVAQGIGRGVVSNVLLGHDDCDTGLVQFFREQAGIVQALLQTHSGNGRPDLETAGVGLEHFRQDSVGLYETGAF